MVSPQDQQRVCALLTEAVTVICKNGLTFNNKFCIEGLLGITLDDRNMFLVNIKESIVKGGKTNQNQSQSMSKAGVFVGMPAKPSMRGHGIVGRGHPNGGRGAVGPVGRSGMSPAMIQQQQHLQRRRPGEPQPSVIPAKRPIPGMLTNANMARGPGTGTPGSMPQEWAALIHLQSQQSSTGMSPRGRPRGTARRGGIHRVPGQIVKSPTRRTSQTLVDVETKEETERKTAEQARLRQERLQRRRSGGPLSSPSSDDGKGRATDTSDDERSRERKKSGDSFIKKDPDAESTTSQDQEQMEVEDIVKQESDDGTKAEESVKDEPTTDTEAESETKELESRDAEPMDENHQMETTEPKAEVSKQQEAGDKRESSVERPEGSEGTKQEGDGSWLLSNSSWLLGDLESMASNTSWKDTAAGDQQESTAKGSQDDGDP